MSKQNRPLGAAVLAASVVLGLSLAGCSAEVAQDSVGDPAPAGSPHASSSPVAGSQPPAQAAELFGASGPSGTELTCPQPGPWRAEQIASVCWFVSNQATVFTGPNQLGPATFSNDSNSNPYPAYPQTCTDNNSWLQPPTSFGKTMQAHFQCQYSDGVAQMPEGGSGQYTDPPWGADASYPQVRYVGPDPFVDTEGITFSTKVEHRKDTEYGPHADPPAPNSRATALWGYDPNCSNDAQTPYLGCSVTYTGDGGSVPNNNAAYIGFELRTYPVIVQIDNNLPQAPVDPDGSSGVPDTLTLDGTPTLGKFLLDPAGGNPTTINPGESGYFGLYKPVPSGSDPNLSTFAVTYTLPADSADVPNTSIALNLELDPRSGQLTDKSSCHFVSNSSTDNIVKCDVQLLGLPLGTQKIAIDVYEAPN